ncbi:hypothetical protein [Roseateles sp.]|uniref:hypothetical protein n=1 Tax=Roseateles sp. TaxID=1971397 RepID=UPI003BA5DB88
MNDDLFFTLPAFKPDDALVQIKRALRDVRSLSERAQTYSLQGQVVLSLTVADGKLMASLAKRPAHSPDWDRRECKSSADVRSLLEEIKRRVARWTDETP